jgi:hypothetical protein
MSKCPSLRSLDEERAEIAYSRRQVKHTLYEDPVTHQFALIKLPNKFIDGDPLDIPPTDRWFATREEAIASLAELLNLEE